MKFARVQRLSAVVFCLVLPSASGGGIARASVVSDNPSAWNLTFADEFSGTALDGAKWENRLPGVRNSAINTPDAVSVGGGNLTITTYTEGGTHYTGMVGSRGKFEQVYGYFESRIKFNTTPGQWSAFWLTSSFFGNPIGDPAAAGTEIDIVEHRVTNMAGNDLNSRYVSAVHWDGYGADHKQVAKTHASQAGLGNDSWHTYGLKWSSTGYDFYFDGALLWSVAEAVSKQNEYLILSSEVRDANWAGLIPAGGYGSRESSSTNMQVDYVRVYQAVPEPSSTVLLIAAAGFGLLRRRGRSGRAAV